MDWRKSDFQADQILCVIHFKWAQADHKGMEGGNQNIYVENFMIRADFQLLLWMN